MALQDIVDLETIIGSANIANLFGVDDLRTISEKVLKEFDIDFQSNREWRDQSEKAMDLAKQVAEKKNTPWPNASNVKIPLITVAATQFSARAYPIIVSGQSVMKGKVIGSDNGIPQTNGNGQPVTDQEGNIVFQVPPGAKRARAQRVGDHMSYQLLEEMEEWEEETDYLLLALPILGCMFRKVFFDPELGRNKSRVLWPDQVVVNNEIKALDTAPRISECFKLYPYQIEERRLSGLWLDVDLQITEEEEALEEFIEQHTRLDMDGDGYPEPYIVTVHRESMEVVRIAPNFDSTTMFFTGAKNNRRIRKIKPIKYYVKYQMFPDPNGGFLGMGLGQLLLPTNEAANTLVNQLVDAGTLANRGGGFIGRGIRMRKGDTRFQIGEFKTVDVGTGSLRDNILPLPVRDPSNVLFSLLGFLMEQGKDISSVQDVTTGKLAQAQQPTTTLALIEQGERVFSGIFKRIHRSLKKEGQLLYALNAKFLTDQEYFAVLDTPQAIARADYAIDIAVVPVSDPNMASNSIKLKRAELEMSQFGNPFVNGLEVTKRFFAAIGTENPEQLIVTPQPDPEVLEMIARLENDRQRADANTLEIKAKVIQAIADATAKLQTAGEDGASTQSLQATFLLLMNFLGVLDVRTKGLATGPQGVAGQPTNQGVSGGIA